ncbi:UNVERIFIED_CONTAM: hypothetical protein FKN15_017301 [Acipenser sinensis]
MGELFRSEEMTLAQLFLQSEAAYCCVSELGELGMVQFRDLNPDVNVFQRKFVNEVRRCEEMDRKLRFVEKEIKKANIPILDTGENPEVPFPRDMIDLEATFEKLENELKEINTNQEALKKNFLELTELKHILRRTQQFFDEATFEKLENELKEINTNQEALKKNFLELTELKHILRRTQQFFDEVRISALVSSFESSLAVIPRTFVAGVINRERIPTFERMMWRVCRGNVFLRQADIEDPLEDPATGDQVHKSVFIIFFQGDQLKNRVKKICEGFRASLYPCPENPQERKEMAAGVNTRIDDLQMVIAYFCIKLSEHKAWNQVPSHKVASCSLSLTVSKAHGRLSNFLERSGSTVPSILNRMQTKQTPPTYNKTNKFTAGFQNIVDAYGIGTYREINPAPYTIITFPFLFAVMFGDFGHGILLTCFAAWLVFRESRILSQRSDNEIWNIATNKLTFLNSFKMKMSVILGIIHMLFGVTLSLFNHIYFKKPLNIYLGFIPEMIFMSTLFGYLVILIIYKWGTYNAFTSKDAPSLLIHFINMFLFNYSDQTNKMLYSGQVGLQCFLVVVALLCVPWMLVVKPLVLRHQYLKKKRLGTHNFGGIRVGNGPTEEDAEIIQHDQLSMHSEDENEFDFADTAVHQAIHTIEYCLGCISNTASYLRLWALSLAHAQLSEVLWTMVMSIGLCINSYAGFVVLFFIFAVFATLTIAILLIMEGLSAFLHALRLHWVEFQNKFYTGQGFKFVPFSFETILDGKFED